MRAAGQADLGQAPPSSAAAQQLGCSVPAWQSQSAHEAGLFTEAAIAAGRQLHLVLDAVACILHLRLHDRDGAGGHSRQRPSQAAHPEALTRRQLPCTSCRRSQSVHMRPGPPLLMWQLAAPCMWMPTCAALHARSPGQHLPLEQLQRAKVQAEAQGQAPHGGPCSDTRALSRDLGSRAQHAPMGIRFGSCWLVHARASSRTCAVPEAPAARTWTVSVCRRWLRPRARAGRPGRTAGRGWHRSPAWPARWRWAPCARSPLAGACGRRPAAARWRSQPCPPAGLQGRWAASAAAFASQEGGAVSAAQEGLAREFPAGVPTCGASGQGGALPPALLLLFRHAALAA